MSRSRLGTERKRGSRGRPVAFVLVGLIVGGIMISPASAHITKSVSHVVKHMKKFFRRRR